MENLRLLCQRNRETGTLLNTATLATQTVEVDQIRGPLEVYARARAWFLTMAFVNIRKQAWFSLQSATFASEKIFDLVQQSSGGRFPPVSFYLEAWAATIDHFAETVRISAKTLSDCVANTGTWEHKWQWSPTAGTGGGGAVDLPRALAADVDQAALQARQLQSMTDRAAHANRGNVNGRVGKGHGKGQGGGKGRGNGGKGAGANGKGHKGNGFNGNGNAFQNRDRSRDRRRDRSRGRDGGRDGGRDRA